jgi:hypothetical protein
MGAIFTVVYGVIAGGFLADYQAWFVAIILACIAQSAFESNKATST